MDTLVRRTSTEVQWHGLVTKIDEDSYVVDDILVYPQIATAATVTSDDEAYFKWLNELPDEQFNAIRFQGHSHVNMHASPSGTDDDYYETLVQHIKDYYIFFILNKRGEYHIEFYDIANNRVYEKMDCKVVKVTNGYDYDAWYDQEQSKITTKPLKTVGYSTGLGYYNEREHDDAAETAYWSRYGGGFK
jgi:hypothetical protein